METQGIKTGNIFYFDSHIPHAGVTHRQKCRVLFVGAASIFYDAWWANLNQWSFVPVRKRLAFYNYPFAYLNQLTFDGFEPIDLSSADKLFLKSPEIILSVTKEEFTTNPFEHLPIITFSSKIVFIPLGPKGGTLKPVYIDSYELTSATLIKKVSESQNIDFIPSARIVLQRVGLHGGFPSYMMV
jgi:hypothetical protein